MAPCQRRPRNREMHGEKNRMNIPMSVPMKCPECGGDMIATESDLDGKRTWFKCINRHVWIKVTENDE